MLGQDLLPRSAGDTKLVLMWPLLVASSVLCLPRRLVCRRQQSFGHDFAVSHGSEN